MSQTEALLFDLDRTLVDLQSFTDYESALRDLTALLGSETGADVPDADWDAPTLTTMAILVSLAGDGRWEAASSAVAAHERFAIGRSTAMPGLDELSGALGDTPRAVITLLPEDVARAALSHHGVDIEVIIGRHPQIPAKPSGAGLVIAAERLGIPIERCVMIGDSSWDRAAAVDAGTAFIGVPVSDRAFGPEVDVADGLLDAVALAGASWRTGSGGPTR